VRTLVSSSRSTSVNHLLRSVLPPTNGLRWAIAGVAPLFRHSLRPLLSPSRPSKLNPFPTLLGSGARPELGDDQPTGAPTSLRPMSSLQFNLAGNRKWTTGEQTEIGANNQTTPRQVTTWAIWSGCGRQRPATCSLDTFSSLSYFLFSFLPNNTLLAAQTAPFSTSESTNTPSITSRL
jgi:hypothetical protein